MSTSHSTSKLSINDKESPKKKIVNLHLKTGVFTTTDKTMATLTKSPTKPKQKNAKPFTSSFVATISPPSLAKVKSFEYLVRHFEKVDKVIESPLKSNRHHSPARNVVEHDDNAPTDAIKHSLKNLPQSYQSTLFSADKNHEISLFQGKKRAPTAPKQTKLFTEEDLRPQGLKTSFCKPNRNPILESADDTVHRQRPGTANHRSGFNPITEGDPASVVDVRQRVYNNEESENRRMNDKRHFLSSERCSSPNKGRVFRDSGNIFSTEPAEGTQPRVLSPAQKRVRGNMQSVIQYEGGPNYRDQGLAGKCTQVDCGDMKVALTENDVAFRRQRVQH